MWHFFILLIWLSLNYLLLLFYFTRSLLGYVILLKEPSWYFCCVFSPILLFLIHFFLLSQHLILVFSAPFDLSAPSLQLSLLWLLRVLVLRELFPTFLTASSDSLSLHLLIKSPLTFNLFSVRSPSLWSCKNNMYSLETILWIYGLCRNHILNLWAL